VSLDGLILTTSSLFLLGLIILTRKQEVVTAGLVLIIVGFILTNLLTYGGVFLLAVGGALGLINLAFKDELQIITATSVALLLFLILVNFMDRWLGYDHIQGFLIASFLENPKGFRGVVQPIKYLMTRIENVSEIALFLSFGCLATLFHRERLKVSLLDCRHNTIRIMLVGITVLLAMFLTGAFKTGETARSCLFIYPYLLLAFFNVTSAMLKDLIILAGMQTAAMQIFAYYFW
jgi:hypothetical protein